MEQLAYYSTLSDVSIADNGKSETYQISAVFILVQVTIARMNHIRYNECGASYIYHITVQLVRSEQCAAWYF